jgi:hypothetical protein
MEQVVECIYCEIHTCIHDWTSDPYEYGYELSGEEPECSEKDWRILWVGSYVKPYHLRSEDIK